MSTIIRTCLTIQLMLFCVFQAYPDSSNLLRNASFEMVTDDGVHNDAKFWKMNKPDKNGDAWGSATRENWRSRHGLHIGTVRGLWAGRGSDGGFWQDIDAEPGKTYRFSGWFYSDPEWIARTQEIKIEFWDEEKQTLLLSEAVPIDDCYMSWEEIFVQATAPEDAVWVRVVVNVINTGACGSLQIDELKLVKAEKEDL